MVEETCFLCYTKVSMSNDPSADGATVMQA